MFFRLCFFGFVSILLSDEEEIARIWQMMRKVDNWILGREVELSGTKFVYLNCGDFQLTIVCDEQERYCGPKRLKLEEVFKEECVPGIKSHYKLDEQKKNRRR
ncbi:MAG: hypothetical protein NZO16_03715 [Deltaproteobacteria bacterium]|nr:hypothetical protein [Deltaproteobacteria bacterium]